jgi:hypothetical protein
VDVRLDMAVQPRTVENYAMRRSEIVDARRRLLAIIHPDWTPDEILKWILTPKPTATPHLDRQDRMLAATAAQWAKQNIAGSQAEAYASMAGYTQREASKLGELTIAYQQAGGKHEYRTRTSARQL